MTGFMSVRLDDQDLGYQKIMDSINDIISKEAHTGFFQEDVVDGIGLAELMAVHEFGSPVRNIPERSAMRTSFDTKEREITDFMFQVGDVAIFENKTTTDQALTAIGDYYRAEFQNGVITKSLGLAENAPRTISRKGSDTPLVDTARLVNGINTKVVDK